MYSPIQKKSWAVLSALILFGINGLVLIMMEIPHEWSLPAWFRAFAGAFMIAELLVAPLGLFLGWLAGFPRWVFPYATQAILMSLYMHNVATPGLKIFGYTFGPRDLWSWRAWLPLGLACAAALLITRSLEPLKQAFRQVEADSSVLAYAYLGGLPLLIAVSFDEMDRLYSFYFMLAFTLILLITSILYVWIEDRKRHSLALGIGGALILLAIPIGVQIYWTQTSGINIAVSIACYSTLLLVFLLFFTPIFFPPARKNEAG